MVLISLAKSKHCSALILSSVQVPFLCTVSIGGMVYSSGRATTKKQAKRTAGWGWRSTHWLGTI